MKCEDVYSILGFLKTSFAIPKKKLFSPSFPPPLFPKKGEIYICWLFVKLKIEPSGYVGQDDFYFYWHVTTKHWYLTLFSAVFHFLYLPFLFYSVNFFFFSLFFCLCNLIFLCRQFYLSSIVFSLIKYELFPFRYFFFIVIVNVDFARGIFRCDVGEFYSS